MSSRSTRSAQRRRPSVQPAEAERALDAPPQIVVTVGTELPFDRLVRAVDDWAGGPGRDQRVFAQTGNSDYRPENIASAAFVDAATFDRLFREAALVVAHAGMGTVLSAMRTRTRLLVMPRRAALGEHRNDHQLASARRLAELGHVEVVFDEVELVSRLNSQTEVRVAEPIGPDAQDSLIDALRTAIESGR